MTTYLPPKKNTAFVFYVSLVSQASRPLFQANPTLAAGDVKVATDDGAPANLATLPVVDADFTRRVKVSLSASEMNGDNITVIFADAAGAEWDDLTINIQTVANQLDDLNTDLDALLALLDDARTEPGQGNPPANPDAVTKLDYLYKAWRNKKTETSTEQRLYADDGSTVDQKRTLSDDGTTLTVGEMATGA